MVRFVLAAPAALHEASAAAATEGLVELCWISVNDPSAGSPTETLLRLLLPLSDMVYLIFRLQLAAQFDSTRENLPGPDIVRIDRLIALS